MKKRLISILSVLCMAVTLLTPISNAKTAVADVGDKRMLLERLGLIEGSLFYEDYVETANFVYAVIKAMGNDNISENDVKDFAVSNGIIPETADMEAELTLDDASAIMIKALGYKNIT